MREMYRPKGSYIECLWVLVDTYIIMGVYENFTYPMPINKARMTYQ